MATVHDRLRNCVSFAKPPALFDATEYGARRDAPLEGLVSDRYARLDGALRSQGLTRRDAEYRDISAVDELVLERYEDPEEAREISPYESLRTIDNGRICLIEAFAGDLAACVYSIRYRDVTWAMRFVIAEEYAGKGLATALADLAILHAIESGALGCCGFIEAGSGVMHHLMLNRTGGVYYDVVRTPLRGIENHYKLFIPVSDPRYYDIPITDHDARLLEKHDQSAISIEATDVVRSEHLFDQGYVAVCYIRQEGQLVFAKA